MATEHDWRIDADLASTRTIHSVLSSACQIFANGSIIGWLESGRCWNISDDRDRSMFNWPLRGMVLLMLLIAVGCNGAANQIDTADHSQIGAEPVCDATVADISGSCSPSYLTPQGAAESVQVLDNGSRIIRNLSYAVHGGLTLQGDLYLPAAVDADTGALVTIHGGGWQDCGRRRNAADAVALVLSSIATVPVFNIDYRLRQEGGGSPDNLSDVVCAAQFISEQAESYGFSGDRVALMGESAGAHLALMASLVSG